MDFSLSPDQDMLAEMVRRSTEDAYRNLSMEARLSGQASAGRWRMLAQQGLLALPFSEDAGGSGLGAVEVMLVMQQLGRVCAVEPYATGVVLAGSILSQAADDAALALSRDIGEGTATVAVAIDEPGSRYDVTAFRCIASESDGGYRLSGRKTLVLDARDASAIIVAAQFEGAPALFLINPDAPGAHLSHYPTLDGRSAADLTLEHAPAERIATGDDAAAIIAEAIERANAALCAEAAGLMAALIEMTLEHEKTREQFGRPLGKFQVLQHRLVDMRTQFELSLSMSGAAAMAIDGLTGADRSRIVSAAKVQACRSGRYISHQAIQLHGAMGMTDECHVSRYAKRLLVIGQIYGDAEHHLRAFARA